MTNFKRLLVFVLFFLFAPSAFPQTIKFNKVKATEDQVSGIITGITQDAQGYMWISSTSGLHRYDGYQETAYRHDPANPNSVGVDRLECLQADTNNILWVGTLGTGLDRFDATSEHFTHFRHDPKNPNSISSDTVFVLKKDQYLQHQYQQQVLIKIYHQKNCFNPLTRIWSLTFPASKSQLKILWYPTKRLPACRKR